jgi:hypothetical protein
MLSSSSQPEIPRCHRAKKTTSAKALFVEALAELREAHYQQILRNWCSGVFAQVSIAELAALTVTPSMFNHSVGGNF